MHGYPEYLREHSEGSVHTVFLLNKYFLQNSKKGGSCIARQVHKTMHKAWLDIFTLVAKICIWRIAMAGFNPSNMKQVVCLCEDIDKSLGNVVLNIF